MTDKKTETVLPTFIVVWLLLMYTQTDSVPARLCLNSPCKTCTPPLQYSLTLRRTTKVKADDQLINITKYTWLLSHIQFKIPVFVVVFSILVNNAGLFICNCKNKSQYYTNISRKTSLFRYRTKIMKIFEKYSMKPLIQQKYLRFQKCSQP